MFIKQNKGKQYDKLPVSKIPHSSEMFYASKKLDGFYVQVHVDKIKETVNFFTSGGEEFHLEKAARGFIHASKSMDNDKVIYECEYNHSSDGMHGDRTKSAKLTTYRTEFKHGIKTVGTVYDRFSIFDIIDQTIPFRLRLELIDEINTSVNVHFLEHHLIPYGDALPLTKEYVTQGWEGLVLKSPTHMWKPGKRVNDIIKIKFRPEMIVKVIEELLGEPGKKYATVIGSLKCKTSDGKVFNVGSGLHDDERENWSEFLDEWIEIEYEQMMHGIPQQPVFKRLVGNV